MDQLAIVNLHLHTQQGMSDVHPLLHDTYPIAIVEDGRICVYDVVAPNTTYSLVSEMPGPNALPGGFLACIELPVYTGKHTRVVAPEMIETLEGQARLVGEAARCGIAERHGLVLTRLGIDDPDNAMGLQLFDMTHDTSWLYRTLVSALLGQASSERIRRLRRELRSLCAEDVWSVVVLNEWRDGLVRYIENKARMRLDLQAIPPNLGPGDPWSRPDESLVVSGGAAFITWLERQKPGISQKPIELLDTMLSLG